jgi:hypothetical protein
MTYTPQLYPIETKAGAFCQVLVQHDNDRNIYVGDIQHHFQRLDGSIRIEKIATGEADTPHGAAVNTGTNLDTVLGLRKSKH